MHRKVPSEGLYKDCEAVTSVASTVILYGTDTVVGAAAAPLHCTVRDTCDPPFGPGPVPVEAFTAVTIPFTET